MSSADFGAKASIPDNNVTDDLDTSLLSFTSANGAPKVQLGQSPEHADILTYTFSSMPSTRTDIITINHGYGYVPFSFVQMGKSSEDVLLIAPISESGGLYTKILDYEIDDEDLVIYYDFIDLGGGSPDSSSDYIKAGDEFIFKYYIFAESGL